MPLMLADLIEKFLGYSSLTNRPSTCDYYRRHLHAFLAMVGDRPADQLKRIDVVEWATTWHRVQTIQRLFAWAVNDAEILTRNPFTKIKKPIVEGRMRVLTGKEIARILRGCSMDYRAYLLALRETIARPQEIRDLTWEMLSLENPDDSRDKAIAERKACFVLTEYKARRRRLDPAKPRIILISARFGRMLLRLLRKNPDATGPVFMTARARAWTPNALRLRMRRLRDKIALGPNANGEAIVAYSFRHTGGTRATRLGIRDRTIAELMGHGSTRTTARYQHLDLWDLKEALRILEDGRRASRQKPTPDARR